MRSFFRQPIDDVIACLERLVDVKRPALRLLGLLLVGAATWIIYVPIHELLHVAGCVVTGGTVSELELSPLYGAAMLQKIFPFIVVGGEYAGRVTGFDTPFPYALEEYYLPDFNRVHSALRDSVNF